MSAPHPLTPPRAEIFDAKHAGGLPTIFLAAGGIGLLGSLLCALIPAWRAQFAFSYLFGFSYFFTLCVGCLFWTCLHHATDSDWSVVVRRQLENVAGLIPYLALLFVPLLFVASYLWQWWGMQPSADALLAKKQPYLSHWFFIVRLVVYFAVLGTIAVVLKWRSISQDRDGAPQHSWIMRKFGVAGIPAIALCLTFAAFDWLMGLDFRWFSTMWGVYIFAGAAGSSMSLLILIVTALKNRGYLNVVNLEHYHIMGKYLLAFVIFWAYIGFSQYMLIWYANIPEETGYFQIRNTHGWWFLSTFLVVGRFFLPLPVLLLQWTKKKTKWLCWTAVWILTMQFVDLYVIVLPALHPGGVAPHLLDLLAFAGIGGILGWLFLRNLARTPIFPTRDPRLAAALVLTN
jgi:hypothetical protein